MEMLASLMETARRRARLDRPARWAGVPGTNTPAPGTSNGKKQKLLTTEQGVTDVN